jgi:SAM domain (Sterile alpha motif)
MMESGKPPLQRSCLPSAYSHSLVNGGLLAPNDPKRHYKYQLLDPVDKPYATIKFYYRPLASLRAMGILAPPRNHSRHTSMAVDPCRTSSETDLASRSISRTSSNRSPARSDSTSGTGSSRHGAPPPDSVTAWLHHHRLQKHVPILATLSFDTLVTFSDEDFARLGISAKGSRAKLLRELDTYQKQHPKQVDEAGHKDEMEKENRSVSRRKSLKIEINDAVFDLAKNDRKGPLSPFTSGGMRRCRLPSSAPANTTAFAPFLEGDVGEMMAEMESGDGGSRRKVEYRRSTRAERGGGMLSRILGKRFGGG